MIRHLSLLCATLLLTSCIAGDYHTHIRRAEAEIVRNGDYISASRQLIDRVNRPGRDRLLYMMEAGQLLQNGGDVESSIRVLRAADSYADTLAKRISEHGLSYLTNESGTTYRGEAHERLLINMNLGMNYLQVGRPEEAMVEFRRANYFRQIVEVKGADRFHDNLLARYLGAVAARANNELDYAYVELRAIHQRSPGLPHVGRALIEVAHELGDRRDVQQWQRQYPRVQADLSGDQSSRGDLIIVHQAGQAPIKQSRGRLLDEQLARAAIEASLRAAVEMRSEQALSLTAAIALLSTVEHPIPRYAKRDYRISRSRIRLIDSAGNQTILEPTLMKDNEESIINGFEALYPEMRNRMIVRITTKIIASLAAQAGARELARAASGSNRNDSGAELIGAVAGFAVGFTTFSMERPDMRSWHTLPARYLADGRRMPEGEYRVVADYIDQRGLVVQSVDQGHVRVAAGKPTLLNLRTIE